MNTATATPTPSKARIKPVKATAAVARNFATHEDLIADMRSFRKTVTASPEAARAFLVRAGLLTKNGKTKQLIRG